MRSVLIYQQFLIAFVADPTASLTGKLIEVARRHLRTTRLIPGRIPERMNEASRGMLERSRFRVYRRE